MSGSTKGKPDYNNSRSLDLHRTSSFAEVDAVAEELIRRIYERVPKGDKLTITKQHLKMVIMELYIVHRIDSERWLGYSRDPLHYRAIDERYNALGITGKRVISITNELRDAGLIDFKKGFRASGDFKQGRLSRMKAKPELIDYLKAHGVKWHMAELCPAEEIIILRAPKKKNESKGKDIVYKDTAQTRRMRENLKYINQKLSEHWIDLRVPDEQIPKLNEQLKRRKESKPFEPSRTRLRRIFNNGSFEQGGRFYGGWWQEIPNRIGHWRSYITIDGQPTYEFDYSGMHLRMLYAKAEESMPSDDPYQLDGYDQSIRKFLKISMNTILNADNRIKALEAIKADAKEWGIPAEDRYIDALMEKFEIKHHAIRQHFYKGVGVEMQYIDSKIAERVMLGMIRAGTIALPVHDSFLVISRWSSLLAHLMRKAFRVEYNSEINLSLEQGKGDPDREELEEEEDTEEEAGIEIEEPLIEIIGAKKRQEMNAEERRRTEANKRKFASYYLRGKHFWRDIRKKQRMQEKEQEQKRNFNKDHPEPKR